MKGTFQVLLIFSVFVMTVSAQENNNFYDNTKTSLLKGPEICVDGEVQNPGLVDLGKLNIHSAIVRESVFRNGKGPEFTGAYRYDGYSIFDILENRYVKKKNRDVFDSVIDLIVVIENKKGDKAVLSWGEIYYPADLHKILIATSVSPILPTKTDEKWPVPEKTKLICGNDLVTVRNIEQPCKIMVITQPLDLEINREISPFYSGKIDVYANGEKIDTVLDITNIQDKRTYPSIFYGRGRGFHGVRHFTGRLLRSLLIKHFDVNEKNLKTGYFYISAVDGYRITLSFSEVFNRNDNNDFLLIDEGEGREGGRFRIFPAPDFFSDRAVKALNAFYFLRL